MRVSISRSCGSALYGLVGRGQEVKSYFPHMSSPKPAVNITWCPCFPKEGSSTEFCRTGAPRRPPGSLLTSQSSHLTPDPDCCHKSSPPFSCTARKGTITNSVHFARKLRAWTVSLCPQAGGWTLSSHQTLLRLPASPMYWQFAL